MYKEPSYDEYLEMGRKFERKWTKYALIISGILLILLGVLLIVIGALYLAQDDDVGIVFLVIGIICIIAYIILVVVFRKRLNKTLKDDTKLLASGKTSYEPTRKKEANEYFSKICASDRATRLYYYSSQYYLREQGLTPTGYANAGLFNGMLADVLFDEDSKVFAICTPQDNPVFDALNVYRFNKVVACSLNDKGQTTTRTEGMDATTGFLFAGFLGAALAESSKRNVVEKYEDYVVDVIYDDMNSSSLVFEFGPNRTLAEELYKYFTIIVRRNNYNSTSVDQSDRESADPGDLTF